MSTTIDTSTISLVHEFANLLMSSHNYVLIISGEQDVHALTVKDELQKRFGAQVYIVDSAGFPARWSLSQNISSDGKHDFSINFDGQVVNSEQVAGVWWRRPSKHEIPNHVTEPRVRDFCIHEARAAFRGWLLTLGSRVINPLAAEVSANEKVLQLKTAARIGLIIPNTLVSNNPSAVRRFATNYPGAIFKAFTGPSWTFVETRSLESEHLVHLESLKAAPAIFQERIPAEADIRVTLIDDNCFSVSIHPQQPGALLDWRLDLSAEVRPHQLPKEVSNKLLMLLRELGLRYGAADLRLTPGGDYVFLELNPGGQFLFAEIHAGLKISQAMAQALLGKQ